MLDPRPFFSVIIPTFNRGALLCHAIKSILKQKNISLEIIIIDDGSHDNTSEIVKGFKDERINYVKTENRERGSARNSGLQISKGAYVNYFDSDDILTDCLFNLRQFIMINGFPDVVYGLVENVSEHGSLIKIVRPRYLSLKKSLLYNNFLACGSVFIKREVALQYLSCEDRRLSGTEDWELWLRLYSTYDFVEFHKVVFKQRQHPLRSLTKGEARQVTERETVFIEQVKKNEDILLKRFSRSELALFIADRYSLITLAQCESGTKKNALEYLFKSLKSDLRVITRKRFWAILKKLIV